VLSFLVSMFLSLWLHMPYTCFSEFVINAFGEVVMLWVTIFCFENSTQILHDFIRLVYMFLF